MTLIAIGYASTMPIGPGSREWLNLFGYDPSLYGLQVLFFLSGYLAWRSLSQGRTGLAFFRNRAIRNWPWVIGYTALVVVLLYPVMCDHDARNVMTIPELLIYFLKTVTLIQPGTQLHGALDNALYACLLQGTIWTFRWGVVAYILLNLLYALRIRKPALYGLGLIALILAHVALNSWTDKTGSDAFASILPGVRLGIAFCFGIVVRQMMHRLPRKARGWALLSVGMLGLAALNYYGFRWTYGIELFATAGWCALAMALLHGSNTLLTDWIDIVVPTYLGIWPITQAWLAAMPTLSVSQLVTLSVGTTVLVALFFRVLGRVLWRFVHRRIQTA